LLGSAEGMDVVMYALDADIPLTPDRVIGVMCFLARFIQNSSEHAWVA